MPSRIKFTKESIAALALRITAAGARTFYVIRRDGPTMAWVKIGAFPDVSVEQARKAAQQVLGDFARGVNPAAKRREEKKR